MKKLFTTLFCIIYFISFSNAAGKRINLYGGFVFDDKFESYYDTYDYYNGKIKGGFQYGAGLEFELPPFNSAEIIWIGQSTTAPTNYYPGGNLSAGAEKSKIIDLSLNYAMGGFTRYFMKEGSKVEPYLTFMLGALFAKAKDSESGMTTDAVKFTWGARLGSNFWMSDRIGIKVQMMLLSATQAAGGTLYFGSGGYGPGTTTASSMLQLSGSTGLVIRLGKKQQSEE